MRPLGSDKVAGGTWSGKFIKLAKSYRGAVGTGAPAAAGRGDTAGGAGTGRGKSCEEPRYSSVAG